MKMGNNGTTSVALFFIFRMFLFFFRVSIACCIKEERESLYRVKASLYGSSERLPSWKGLDCCGWEGVGCDHTNGGHVIKLDLRNYEYSFSSALPSLFELKYLSYLDLSGNFFNYSQVPPYLGEMLELTYLNLSLTDFQGTIPRSLRNLTKLVALDLNGLELFTDSFEWVSSLSSLEYLDLSGVKAIKGNLDLDLVQVLNSLPSLLSLKLSSCGLQNTHHVYTPLNSSSLSKLQHLDLSRNMFDGPISSIFHNTTSLRYLDLHNNMYNSSIPTWLTNLRNLETLNLERNLFSGIEGGLFSIVGNNCQLKSLHLSTNFFEEDIFESNENISTNCKEYSVERLELERMIKVGRQTVIPSWLGELKNLKFLYLGNNSLCGQIPSSFGNLSSLEKLEISYNMLNGGIPFALGKLLNLTSLNLRENNLDGVIPESFGQLRSLVYLDLAKNYLKGVISEIHFVNTSRLELLILDGNGLLSFEMKNNWVPAFQLKALSVSSILGFGTTEFPRWIGTQKQIGYLNLFNTNIAGPIPTWLRSQNLHFLYLSHNQITGSLLKSIDDQMPNLKGLLISNARINGSLPRSLCKLKNLWFLRLSNNRLSGTIPSCLSIIPLIVLDLSSNNLSGVFPCSFQNLSNLVVMNLARNQLEGEPLMAMKSFKSLSVLDLEGNKFYGNIPEWAGKSLQSLQILNLGHNMFNGTIPSTLWLLSRLQILILHNNKLAGNIPSNVGNFSARRGSITNDGLVCEDSYTICYIGYITQSMKSSNLNYSYLQIYSMVAIDLSNNNFNGHIPKEMLAINDLFALNLSHNNLSGTIPVEIGRSAALESLDLSFNQLSGSIPNSMASLSSLGVLDLSNNNFFGHIPQEGHLSTFNDANSYKNNPYLCGDPLPVLCPDDIDNFHDNDGNEEDKLEKMWFYIIVMVGYAFGFWGVVGSFIMKRRWRHAYFKFMDEMKDKIYVALLVNSTRLKQRMEGNNMHQ